MDGNPGPALPEAIDDANDASTQANGANVEIAAPNDERFPLTPRQTLMWMDRKLFPEVPLHHIGLGLRLRGPLDLDRLQGALRRVWATTDCLRLRIDEDRPEQWFSATQELQLEFADLSASPADERAWRGALTCRRFGIGGPLVRTGLARLSGREHLLLIAFHHILADGATAIMLANRLAAAYAGEELHLASSYRQHLQHNAEYLSSVRFAEDAAYWSGKLGRGTTPLDFYGRAHVDGSLAVATVPVADTRVRLDRMAKLARDGRMALVSSSLSQLITHATLLAGYTHRATGNQEIVVALPYANRPGPRADVAGLTMEQLFIKLALDDDETFLSLAQKIRQEVLATLRHGSYCVSERGVSFVQLNLLLGKLRSFGDLDLEFDPREAHLFDEQVAGLRSSPRNLFGVNLFQLDGQPPKYELTFHAATFPEATRIRAHNHFLRMLDAMVADIDTPIAEVHLVDEEERRILVAFGDGGPPDQPAQDLIAKLGTWVEREPDATAVATPHGDCDYRELQRRVRLLATSLAGLGVGPEQTVGVCLPRSLDEIVALLAVLQAGGAYVPVDPAHPMERTRLVLEDARPSVVLTLSTLAQRFPDSPVIKLDQYLWTSTSKPPLHPASEPSPGQLAYVLFTSGSTGRPKGVEVTRGNLSNFLASMAHTPGLSRQDRVVAITTATFDIAALELFLPLYVGAVVELVDRDTASDPRLLRKVLERPHPKVTLMQATPATWRMLVDAGFTADASLRMLCGGEALSPELARKLTAGGAELWNMYGPTETTVWSSLERVRAESERITVGTPIDRTDLYVMGAGLELEPIGAIGEICIGGAGVARGYRGRPELTAERFFPDPVRGGDARLYRTGDLGRWRDNGRLECLGRIDHQVKIRGFRIELGEIESCLRGTPGVAEALVVARPRAPGEPRLVAYWTGTETRHHGLAERARVHLPAYMHPADYIHLPAFPLNTNGKIDRKSLPDPAESSEVEVSVKAPADHLERRLLEIWRTLLGRQTIGVDQSFFDLGGDSIMVVALAAKIAAEVGVDPPLSRILEAPTIEKLARALASEPQSARGPQSPKLVELKPGHGKHFFFVHDGDGETLLYRALALLLPDEVAAWGITPDRDSGLEIAHRSLDELARAYVARVRARQERGPYHLAGLCAGGIIAFEMARQLESVGEIVAPLVILDAAAPDAAMRLGLKARRRLSRVARVVSASYRSSSIGNGAREVVSRAGNMLDYEMRSTADRFLVWLRRWVLRTTVHRGQAWPKWLTPPSIRERCLDLQRSHTSGRLETSTVLLVRANGGDGSEADRPLREQYADPFLGWGHRVRRGLEILDLSGGHSTILRGDDAGRIAARLDEMLRVAC
jgi:amino acid adenylation domain-containing protein